MNAELTAENRPACTTPDSVFSAGRGKQTAYKDKGGVQVLVILPHAIPVKFCGFLPVHGEKVGPRVIGPQRIEEFLESRVEAAM